MKLGFSLGRFRNRRWCDDLPEGVWVEIFSWLPAESLIRFKCVCKSWYALINFLVKDSAFVDKHFRNVSILSSTSKSTCLVFCHGSFGYSRHPELEFLRQRLFKSVTMFRHHKKRECVNYVSKNFRLPTLPSNVELLNAWKSHCDGIICLAYYGTTILCNPTTQEWRTLPNPCLDGDLIPLGMGFGYDSRANDYKVIRFGRIGFRRDQIEYFKTRAVIYSLRRDSWRETAIHLEFDARPYTGEEVFCKGVFYWFVWTHNVIISFNMCDEVFYSTLLPSNLIEAIKEHPTALAVWNESIALYIYWQSEGVAESIEVWMRDDCSGGVKGFWIKKLIIRPPVPILYPSVFMVNDEVLMQATTGTTRFILYNIRSQRFRNLTIEGVKPHQTWEFSYVRSLLSVQGGSHSP